MHIIDISIFVLYMLSMLGVGIYFLKRNKSQEDYYVGGRKMTSVHIGLSVVATDVGGVPDLMGEVEWREVDGFGLARHGILVPSKRGDVLARA